MPRNMSFAMTTRQFLDGSKTVTRRTGWKFLKAGDIVCGVEKGMGLKKGEKVKRLGLIRILHVNREPLWNINLLGNRKELTFEGFPNMSGRRFIVMFCDANGGDHNQIVTRIEFEHIEGGS